MSYLRKTIDELTPRFDGVVRLARKKDLGITPHSAAKLRTASEPRRISAQRVGHRATGTA
jgi:hypothetical protein